MKTYPFESLTLDGLIPRMTVIHQNQPFDLSGMQGKDGLIAGFQRGSGGKDIVKQHDSFPCQRS